MKVKIVVSKGVRGRWRWQARSVHDNPNMVSEYEAGGPPHGFDTENEAVDHAKMVFSAKLMRVEHVKRDWRGRRIILAVESL